MPEITPQFLLDLIRRDAGIQKTVETAKDVGTGVARTPGNLAGSLVDLIRMVAPKSSEAGSSKWINEKLGIKEPRTLEGKSAEVAASFISPETLAAKIGALGILGGAGRKDLMLTRGVELPSLQKRLQEEFPNFKQPSLAVYNGEGKSDHNFPFSGGDDAALLVMNPAAVDPAYNPFSYLANRDLYVTRGNQFIPNIIPRTRDLGMTEGQNYWSKEDFIRDINGNKALYVGTDADPQHDISVFLSPVFKSFKAFEESPRGAATLDTYRDLPYDDIRNLRDQASSLLRKIYGSDKKFAVGGQSWDKKAVIADLKSAPKGTAKYHLKNLLTQMPSDYAELKYRGRLPVNAHTVMGAVLPPHVFTGAGNGGGIVDDLIDRGIPVMDTAEFNKLSNTERLETFRDIQDWFTKGLK